jgi:hypothetical protein
MSFATRPPEAVRAAGRRGAARRVRCIWCKRAIRPCNLGRHIAAAHFQQLTIDDVFSGKVR